LSLIPASSDPSLTTIPSGTAAEAEGPASTQKKRRSAGLITAAILIGILIIAAFFRFYGRDFDQGHNQHPDERYIVGKTLSLTWPQSFDQFLNVESSPLNLRGVSPSAPGGDHYPYGSFPVYLVKFTGWLADSVLPHTNTQPKGYYLTDYNGVTQLGRTLAAVFDLITIFLVFLIGRRLFSRNAGLVAAALVAFSVTNIQIAHF